MTRSGIGERAARSIESEIVPASTAHEFFSHAHDVTEHCPFLAPSIQRDLLYICRIDLGDVDNVDNIDGVDDVDDVEWRIFRAAAAATEWFRRRRVELGPSEASLLCVNLTIDTGSERSLKDSMDWPHYCLKTLYTEHGVMFGKFWHGEDDVSRKGKRLPIPLLNFISIRSAILGRDPYFFTKAPELLPALRRSTASLVEVLPEPPREEAMLSPEHYHSIKTEVSERLTRGRLTSGRLTRGGSS